MMMMYVYKKTAFYLNSMVSRSTAGGSHVGHELNLIRCVSAKVGKKMDVAGGGGGGGFKNVYQYALKTVG